VGGERLRHLCAHAERVERLYGQVLYSLVFGLEINCSGPRRRTRSSISRDGRMPSVLTE
jgi:hypothetical protein